ncbi:MAG TPA: YciI family protein [Gaiellaceae bacterium]|nr:YciI family protein [Gaiellaceae bacterium]
MKFIALIHNNPAAWQALSQAERDQHNSDADVFLERLTESGELLGGAVVLAHPSNAKTVRVRNGVPAVTDGPFAEGKELLAGYYVLECESMERATEIVTGDPSARHFAVEVRPIMHMSGSDL